MDEFPQAPDKFLSRQMRKRHLASVWAGLAGLERGMTVLDIGSGPGVLAAAYADMAAPGVVYALDTGRELHEQRANLVPVGWDFAGPAPDIVFCTDVLHHAADPAALLRGVRAICAPATRLLVAEYDPAMPGLVGAKPARRMPREKLLNLLAAAGFDPSPVMDSADEHYAVVARTA
jgi:2-polyprenyl-3-methyl-5-hydroxy-6-metoxy-1,4-benzoquinol methylase